MKNHTSAISGCHAPSCVWNKVVAEVTAFRRGKKNYSRTKQKKYLVIRIGFKWRVLSKDDGNFWQLMTHETYNRELKL